MKKSLLISLLLMLFVSANAKHITGGEIIYDFISSTSTSKTYRITLLLFRDQNCDAAGNCAPLPATAKIGIFNRDNNELYGDYHIVNQTSSSAVPINTVPTCITNPPSLSYRVGYYSFTVTLPNNSKGYTAAYQTCCRIDGIENINNNVGATYTAEIPGNTQLAGTNGQDNSPRFTTGISIVCFNKPFTLDFSATDPDGDQLVYELCDAYNGGGAQNADVNYSPSAPPYGNVAYTNGYQGYSPLGDLATINQNTGIISGTAPEAGRYVVCVCVFEYRNGNLLGVHKKDFIITVAPCELAGVQLEPNYITCDGFSYTFENLISSPLNLTTYWDFGDPASPDNISTDPVHTHVFSDTGVYTIKLVVNRGGNCSDSTYSTIKVYPGYFPALDNNSPRCTGSQIQFNDHTTANYGVVNSWWWDFGDPGSSSNNSSAQNPVHVYTSSGTYQSSLIVASDKGCIDTVYKDVVVLDKPPFTVTNDTLICSVDNLQLTATATESCCVTWSPNYNISNINSFTPIVHPQVTTTYTVTYSDVRGCSITDYVQVRVVDTVSLSTGNDTTICRGDAIVLNLETDALQFAWTESPSGNTLNNATLGHPLATPTAIVTTYYVTGNIGSCVDSDSIKVKTVPYPVPNAGADQRICAGTSTALHASGGSSYSWSPEVFLNNPNSANTDVILPSQTTYYIVTVTDTLGCPKPITDGVVVFVNTPVADAGPRDTSIVQDQPLQLSGTGSTYFHWEAIPDNDNNGLSNANISNPVALPSDNIVYVLTTTDSIGCFDKDTITVHYYKLAPDFYVPTGFSPNGDGTNDILKPIALGLRSVDAFKVYNRWGEMVYSTSRIGQGWDGKYKGADQAPGTYVWFAEGTDYKGKKLFKKGTVVLIR
ncbi:MAG: gliding motility-associated C-terminal domain-containing protein [Bacteroidetes bacterium]|nr:gliding motility-associated C-terminal domain-containing protein [Bacteroidota bacterium]